MEWKKLGWARWYNGERVAVLSLLLFPLFVAGGFATPGWVRLIAQAEVAEMETRDIVRDRIGPYGHRPLSMKRGLFSSSTVDLVELDGMFAPADYQSGLLVDQMARVSVFESTYGKWNSAAPAGQAPMSVIFPDFLAAQDKASTVWAKVSIQEPLALCPTLHAANCVTDDDMTPPTFFVRQVVPEPSTALLLALGLCGMSVARRYSV